MKTCNCCSRPVAITSASRVRPMINPFMYALLWECACQNTLSCVLWEEVDEEDLLLDGDLYTATNSLSDLRPEEAA
ncbi:MAG TPA: hypothetical protein VL494_13435 [Steroidobacteraceae bacterium]|jgi:hypothetical protein|nr:hypothetical protein [Steroidobacteraceae bacterium]